MSPAPEGTVVTIGEALLRLTPPGVVPIGAATSFDAHVGGSEANVAAGLATLGVPARWFSRLPNGPLGDRVLSALRALGVDVSCVARGEGRLGLYFVADGVGARPAQVVYDRHGTTFADLRPADASPALWEGAVALHLSGIDLAVPDAPLPALRRLWDDAGRRGLRRSFDVNVRTRLLSAERLGERADAYLGTSDVVLVAERDARALLATTDHAPLSEVARQLRERAPHAVLVVTRGPLGAAAYAPDGAVAERSALPAGGPGRIGRGDAFAAGFLARWGRIGTAEQDRERLESALAWGVAAASYKASIPGDLAALDAEAVRAWATGDGEAGFVR